jgi:general stress protein YciG
MPNRNPHSDTSNRGFASMDEQKQREIARKGGESVPAEKRSFSQNRELASEAGRKGGRASGAHRAVNVNVEDEEAEKQRRAAAGAPAANPTHEEEEGEESGRDREPAGKDKSTPTPR